MELDPRLKELCLVLLDFEGTPVLSRELRSSIVAVLHSQAKCIMEQEIPVLTQVLEFGPDIVAPKRSA